MKEAIIICISKNPRTILEQYRLTVHSCIPDTRRKDELLIQHHYRIKQYILTDSLPFPLSWQV